MRRLAEKEIERIFKSDAEFESGKHRPAEEVFSEVRERLRVAGIKKQSEKGAHVRQIRRPFILASRERS